MSWVKKCEPWYPASCGRAITGLSGTVGMNVVSRLLRVSTVYRLEVGEFHQSRRLLLVR